MKRSMASAGCLLSLCLLCQCQKPGAADDAAPRPHRSPIDLVLLDEGRRAVVANHSADSIVLVDLTAGRVLHEEPAGSRPAALALSSDRMTVAVSNYLAHTVALFDVRPEQLLRRKEFFVGALPRGLTFSKDGQQLYVALSGVDEVITVDIATAGVTQRWPAPREPRHVRLSGDGRWLVA
jgi:DNA-binding beta-propeller fold protein YncE